MNQMEEVFAVEGCEPVPMGARPILGRPPK